MLKRLIIFLVRKKLKLRKYEPFQFDNQKSNAIYYFTEDAIIKAWRGTIEKSSVSLNWLLDDECKLKELWDEEAL